MGAGSFITRFFISWGLKYLILLFACLIFLEIPYEKIGPLMLVVLIATIAGEGISRFIAGGM